jgi:hypothetical protein
MVRRTEITTSDGPKEGKGRTRGLTSARYLTLNRLVNEGKTTWEKLEQEGLALPSKRKSCFRKMVEKKLGIASKH